VTARFDTVIAVDWSARSGLSPVRPSADAIWACVAGPSGEAVTYHRTRAAAEAWLRDVLAAERTAGRRVLAGFDFPFGYPAGFAAALTGTATARAVWQWLDGAVTDGADNGNNRFALADRINAGFASSGPFWGRPAGQVLADLSDKKRANYAGNGLAERRRVETVATGAKPVWQLLGAGCAGSQALLGLPMIHRLARDFGAAVWPFDAPSGGLVLAEIYPSLLAREVARAMGAGDIKDAVQVRLTARSLRRLAQGQGLGRLLDDVPEWPGRAEEGWILGAGLGGAMAAALAGAG
jgi:molybdopterin-guanine dinucleotide biosynthesis adapter protein